VSRILAYAASGMRPNLFFPRWASLPCQCNCVLRGIGPAMVRVELAI